MTRRRAARVRRARTLIWRWQRVGRAVLPPGTLSCTDSVALRGAAVLRRWVGRGSR